MKNKIFGDFLKRALNLFSAIFPLTLLVFTLNPFLILSGSKNIEEPQTILILLALSFISSVSASLLSAFFSLKFSLFLKYFFQTIFIVSFVISIFYPTANGPLDGQKTVELSGVFYLKFYLCCFLGVGICFFLFSKKNKLINVLYKTMAICSIIIATYYSYDFFMHAESKLKNNFALNDLSFGSKQNIIFIMADMLQGSTSEQYFTMYPEEKKHFEGFTLFSRAISPFPFTNYGLPALLTGYMYGDSNHIKDTAEECALKTQHSSLLTDAEDAGFYSTVIGIDKIKIHKNQISFSYANPLYKALTLLSLSLKRVAKKDIFVFNDSDITILIGYKKNSIDIMQKLIKAPIGKKEKGIVFFHNMLPHCPVFFTRKKFSLSPKELNVVNNMSLYKHNTNVGEYFSEMGFFFDQLTELFRHLRKIGTYDDALIIIVADHGHFIGGFREIYNFPGNQGFQNGYTRGPWARSANMYNPAVFIKFPYRKQDLKISHFGISNLTLRSLIKKYISNKSKNFELKTVIKHQVAVFKKDIKTNPYAVSDDHVLLEFQGGINTLVNKFQEASINNNIYALGSIANIGNFLGEEELFSWIVEEKNAGVWLKGEPANFLVNIQKVQQQGYTLRFKLSALVNKKHLFQRINVYLNGNKLGIMHITSGTNVFDLAIPKNHLKKGINKFTLEPLDFISPAKIGAWNFYEPLSAFFYSFQIL